MPAQQHKIAAALKKEKTTFTAKEIRKQKLDKMSLVDQINNDLKEAMKAKEKEKVMALRAVKSALLLAQTAKGADGQIDPNAELKILQKQVKQRKEAAETFKAQGRDDLYENEMREASIIEPYLPQMLEGEELIAEIKAIIAEVGASSMKEMGKVMGAATKKLAGKAEGKSISDAVKQLLS